MKPTNGSQAVEVRRTLTPEEMGALATAPVTLTDVPALGTFLVLISLRISKAAGAYRNPKPLEVLYGAGGPQAGRVTGTVLGADEERDDWGYPARPDGDEWPLQGVPLVATSDSDYTGNGGAIELTVRYVGVQSG